MPTRVRRGVYLLPAALTLANLFCGFYAIIAVYRDDYTHAAIAILVALLLDFLDGAVARLTHAASDFGVQMDSLADLVAFGIAPGFLAYVYTLKPFGRLGWLAAFTFAACGALRLARFNVTTTTMDKRYFVGLPIPAAAGVIAALVLFMRESSSLIVFDRELLGPQVTEAAILVLVYALAFLMVSRFRYRSLKAVDLREPRPATVLFVLLLALLLVAAEPVLFLFGAFLLYALSGPARMLASLRRTASADRGEDLELRPGEPAP
jgi:CDP-diacylglycerol--serine O-phosphatidyltransferase